MIILGIETSCDETSAALLEIKQGQFEVLSNIVSTSQELQAKYGGIVPEVAARKQMEYMIPVLQDALGKKKKNNIEAVAVTVGPGLATSLQVGIDTAKTIAYVWDKPLVPANHLEGHLYSPLLNGNQTLNFPAIGLIVSGGHTELILLKDYLNYELLGRTRDDAAGEAFDKAAKLLGLGYPGGPVISRLAKEGDPEAYDFPRGMIDSPDYDFSFSGLKTAVLYAVKKDRSMLDEQTLPHVAASFEAAVIDVLAGKVKKAIQEYSARTLLVGGGVAADTFLRARLQATCAELGIQCLISPLKNTGDNAAMIALAGYFRYRAEEYIRPEPQTKAWKSITAQPNLRLV